MEALKNKVQALEAKRQESQNERQSLIQLSVQLAEKSEEYQEARQLLTDGLSNDSLDRAGYNQALANVRALKARVEGLSTALENAQNNYGRVVREAIQLETEMEKEF